MGITITGGNTFTSGITMTLPGPQSALVVEYLVIGGGGGGGAEGNDSGGGGAGGYRSSVAGEQSGGGAPAESPFTLAGSTTFNVTVGTGGAANANGTSSIFHTVTSLG